jgi:hypothetical protein
MPRLSYLTYQIEKEKERERERERENSPQVINTLCPSGHLSLFFKGVSFLCLSFPLSLYLF